MENIGLYRQTSEFTIENAGTSEWCRAERGGKQYFVKKLLSPVYPSKDIGLSEKFYKARVEEFHRAITGRQEIYRRLGEANTSGLLVVPVDTINYQYHICTIADYIDANVRPDQVCLLSEWQRLVLLHSLTLALMNVHQAGVVHSDMKPDNVLIRQDEEGNCRLFLIDFDGSYLAEDAPSDPEKVHGDLAYFAPEIYRMLMEEDVRPDFRTDVFALGLIFHYLWCGKLPPKPADQTVGEHVLLTGELGFDPSVPPSLRELIRRMLLAKPEDRIALNAVYGILGVFISKCPPSVEILPRPDQAPPRAEIPLPPIPPVPSPVSPVPPPEKEALPPKIPTETVVLPERMSAPVPEPPVPFPAGYGSYAEARVPRPAEPEGPARTGRVAILSLAEDGTVLARHAAEVAFGSSRTIRAIRIEGYTLVSAPVLTAQISSRGEPNGPLRFIYRPEETEKIRKPSFLKFMAIFLLALMIWWGIGSLLAFSTKKNGNWQASKTFMDITPGFQYIFPDPYEDVVNKLNAAGR